MRNRIKHLLPVENGDGGSALPDRPRARIAKGIPRLVGYFHEMKPNPFGIRTAVGLDWMSAREWRRYESRLRPDMKDAYTAFPVGPFVIVLVCFAWTDDEYRPDFSEFKRQCVPDRYLLPAKGGGD